MSTVHEGLREHETGAHIRNVVSGECVCVCWGVGGGGCGCVCVCGCDGVLVKGICMLMLAACILCMISNSAEFLCVYQSTYVCIH